MSQQTRTLGRSGIEVSTLALGTMMFGSWGNDDVAECRRMVHRAIDAGITLFDTADMYDNGVAETILGDALRGHRDRVVLATKVGNPMNGDPIRRGLSRRWIVEACEDSLRRLGVDHIDLYQMHRPDPSTPAAETLAAFDDLVTSGKVGAIGTSTFSADQIEEMMTVASTAGLTAPVSEQPPYSALTRGIETNVLPACRRHDLGVIVWAPLNGGWLTGKYQGRSVDGLARAVRQPDHFDHGHDEMRITKLGLVDSLSELAAQAGLSLTQLALGFVLDDDTVTAAIIGPRTLAQLEELLTAGHVALPAGVRDAIDGIVAPGLNVNPADGV
ncbi:MAG TPA: aldo/keto reductase [Ilumatobacteraceae bacterium]